MKKQYPDAELNMTPMIDVVFQLIIFFVTSIKPHIFQKQNLPFFQLFQFSVYFFRKTVLNKIYFYIQNIFHIACNLS